MYTKGNNDVDYHGHHALWQKVMEKNITLEIFASLTPFWCKEKVAIWQKILSTLSFFVNPPDGAEHVQKCIESKNRHHFEKPTFLDVQLCCLAQKDSSTPKVLKLHFVSVKHGSVSIWNVAHSMFDIEAESCLSGTKCNFRTLRVDESFWAKQQSCIS